MTEKGEPLSDSAHAGFPIVGIGASAGGLQALTSLLDAMPEDPGVAIVIVQHLDPTRRSLTAELLAKHTKMRVHEVHDDPYVRPNGVYVIPPDKYLSISEGTLHLSEPDRPRGARMAIDFFLRSLALDQKQRAVGVILSGTGSDGTLGVKAIKAAGGLVIAQDLASAEHDGMPFSAIDTGVVDHILAPDQIPDVLVSYARDPYARAEPTSLLSDEDEDDQEPQDDGLGAVIAVLRAHTKHDFRNYKEKTLVRRTRRRMCLLHMDAYDRYLDFLRTHPAEIEALVKDLLITVTDFFREPEAWEEMRKLVIRPLIEKKDGDEPIRVWTPGCSTGEEPYSMAIVILEELMRAEKTNPLNLFASDIDRDAIAFARAGRYPKSIAADVAPERLRRFFSDADGAEYYRVNKLLRESVVFADQDLIADPPFSKLDIICCRNLLIYLKAEVQEKIIALFHFALLPQGALFLGSAETIGRQTDLFTMLSKRWRIFRRIGPTHHDRVAIPIAAWRRHREEEPGGTFERRQAHLTHLAQQRLLDLLAPPAVLIDSQWKMLYVTGNVDPYLMHRPGSPTDNLLDKVRRGLRSRLRMVVQRARAAGQTATVQSRVERDGEYFPVSVTVRLLRDRLEGEVLALVVFEESADAEARPSAERRHKPRSRLESRAAQEDELDEKSLVVQLEEELAATKDDLQATIEQLEASNEEYKATNEESMSVNEELQSTNEELETSKEELQSLNEELSTVNSQLAAKVDELETKHADLENLLAATAVATLCLNTDLAVRWFTTAVRQVVRLKDSDVGRPLADLAHDFKESGIVEVAKRVLSTLTPLEDEVSTVDDRTYLRRVTPYRMDDLRIGGVMLTFVDITRRKQDELALRSAKELSDLIIDTVREATLVLDADLVVLRANRTFYEKFRVVPAETEGRLVYELGNGQWNIPQLRTLLEELLPQQKLLVDFTVDHVFQTIGRRVMILNARALDPEQHILLAIEDVTELLAAKEGLENQIKERTEMLRQLQDVTRAANEAHTTEEALRVALERIARHHGWPIGHVWRVSRDGSGELVSSGIWYASDPQIARELQQRVEGVRIAPGEGLIGGVAVSREPGWVDNNEQPARHHVNAPQLGLRAAIAFPVVIGDQAVAVLEFLTDHPARREDRFMEIMPDVGFQLGHVIERKRLERDVDNAAAEQQRHIGRELHDSISQELTGIGMMAETLKARLGDANVEPSLVTQAERLVTHLRSAQKQVSQLSRGLVPAEVEAEGLVSALEDLVLECNELRGDSVCKFRCTDTILLEDRNTATNLYRIAQEAIQNAWKHAEPSSIVLRLALEDGDLLLCIENDGVKASTSRTSRGRGLRIMQYRAGLIGARLHIDARSDRFTVTCRLNLRAQQS